MTMCKKPSHNLVAWTNSSLELMLQGLNWYTDKLKQDRDGDVADEFLLERSSQSSKSKQTSLQVRLRMSFYLTA